MKFSKTGQLGLMFDMSVLQDVRTTFERYYIFCAINYTHDYTNICNYIILTVLTNSLVQASHPLVGSSRNITPGLPTNAKHSDSLRFIPPLSCDTSLCLCCSMSKLVRVVCRYACIACVVCVVCVVVLVA